MRLYVGDTRSRALLDAIATRDSQRRLLTGQLVQRGSVAAWTAARLRGERDWLWALDNGAYADWRAGRAFDADAWQRDLDLIDRLPRCHQPGWLVLPDIVSGGERSLELSLGWLDQLWQRWPCYLALQEGIDPSALPPELQSRIDGWFIGGATWAWKASAAREAVAWTRDPRNPAAHDQRVHVGRAGSARRIEQLRRIGVASCDSNGPLWSRDAWRIATHALGRELTPTFAGWERYT